LIPLPLKTPVIGATVTTWLSGMKARLRGGSSRAGEDASDADVDGRRREVRRRLRGRGSSSAEARCFFGFGGNRYRHIL